MPGNNTADSSADESDERILRLIEDIDWPTVPQAEQGVLRGLIRRREELADFAAHRAAAVRARHQAVTADGLDLVALGDWMAAHDAMAGLVRVTHQPPDQDDPGEH